MTDPTRPEEPTLDLRGRPPANARSGGDAPTLPAAPVGSDAPRAEGKAFGRYVLLEELGRGGMGVVWKAWDTELKRVVALKQVLAEESPSQVERFVREARAAARLRHPAIIAVHDVGVVDGQHYFTSEYVEGRSLEKLDKPLPQKRAIELVKAVAEALAYAHEQGILHRDVKPANILIDAAGRPYLMDFGLAKEIGKGAAAGLTLSGDVVGTPAYMSPEQARGQAEAVGPASDQFSLGAVLYELLTGACPFDGPVLVDVLNAVIERDPVRLTSRNSKVHRDAETICQKAMEKTPARRYPSMAAFAADLGRVLDNEPVEAKPVSLVGRQLRRAARHRRLLSFLGAAVLLAGAAFAVYVHRSRAERDRALGDERRRAEDAERVALKKAKLVQDALARWGTLTDTIQGMESACYDSSLRNDLEERRRRNAERWAEVERFLRGAPDDATSQAVMKALAGHARRLAGFEDEGLAWMREGARLDPDVPYGAIMEAMVLSARYFSLVQPRWIAFQGEARLRASGVRETREMQDLRARIRPLLEAAGRARVWGEEVGGDFHHALQAMEDLQGARFQESEAELSKAIGTGTLHPYEADLRLARGKLRLAFGKPQESQADLQWVSRLRPMSADVLGWLAMVRGVEGYREFEEGKPSLPAMLAAAALLKKSIDLDPGLPLAHVAQGLLLSAAAIGSPLGSLQAAHQRAIEEYGKALALDPECDAAYAARAFTNRSLGDAEQAHGADPRPYYERSIADDGELLARSRDDRVALWDIAQTYQGLAQWQGGHGIDPSESYRQVFSHLDEALKIDPRDPVTLNDRGYVHWMREEFDLAAADFDASLAVDRAYRVARLNRGMMRQAQGDPSAAIADFDELLKGNPRDASALRCRGLAREAAGDGDAARSDLQEALACAPPGWRHRADVEYGLARLLSLASAGKGPARAEAKPVAPEDSARLRDGAFEHLRKAAALGYADKARLLADADLLPLHDDPRWKELLGSLR